MSSIPRASVLRLAESASRSGRTAELQLVLQRMPAPAPPDEALLLALLAAADTAGDLAALTRITALWPDDGRPQGAAAQRLDLAGHSAEALPLAEAALRLRPTTAHRLLRARIAYRLGDRPRAAELWRAVLASEPKNVPALRNLAALEASQQAHALAIDLRRRAVEAAPDRPELRFELAHALDRAGEPAEAAAVLDALACQSPTALPWRWQALRLHLIEPVPETHAALQGAVDAWDRRVQTFAAQAALAPPAALFGAIEPAFPLHYLLDDPLPPQRALAALIAPAAAAAAPWTVPAPRPDRSLRVGFASAFFRGHTVGRLFGGWAAGLAARGVEVEVLHTGHQQDAETAALAGRVRRLQHLPVGAAAQVQALRAMKLDAVIFPELGMDTDTLWAAAARCAPLQAMGWGHPISSGLPAVDWFLSSAAMEPPDGADHYTEQLVALPGLSVQVEPAPPPPPTPRSTFGLPDDRLVLLCLQSLFKLLPAHDAALAAVAAAHPQAVLAVVAHPSPRQTARFAHRLRASFATAGAAPHQLVVVPQQPRARFLALIAAADLILDGPGWSGGHTTLECAALGQPVVSRWGPQMRMRHSAAIQQALGLHAHAAAPGPHADPFGPWVSQINALINDPDTRARARTQAKQAAPGLLRDPSGVEALHAALRHATGRG